jgi:uncharacterized membrane protein YfcA
MNQPTRNPTSGSRLPRWQRLTLYIIGSGVAASGLMWFGLRQRQDSDDIFSAWLTVERTTGVLHGAMSLAMLVVFGSMLPVHVRSGWRSKANFISGTSLLTALSILSLSGAALYYVANEQLRWATTWIHELVGAASVIVCLLHRRARSARHFRA